MAHVKCRYTRYQCSLRWRSECFGCEEKSTYDDFDSSCRFLDSYSGYFEGDSKSIDFDGKVLTVGRKFFAYIDDSFEWDGSAGDNCIDYLEIDGVQYYPEEVTKDPDDGGTKNEME